MARYSGPAVVVSWSHGHVEAPTALVDPQTVIERLTEGIPPERLASAVWTYNPGQPS